MRRAGVALLLAAGCGGSTPGPEVSVRAPAELRPQAFRDGEVLSYRIQSKAGQALGRAHSLYLGTGALPQVRTRVALEGGPAESLELVTALRPDGSPASFKALSSASGRYELRFKDRAVSVITEDGARDQPYVRDGAVLLPAYDLMALSLALTRSELKAGSVLKLSALSPRSLRAEAVSVPLYADPQGRLVAALHWSGADGALSGGKATLDGSGRVLSYESEQGWLFVREEPPGEAPKVELKAETLRYVRPPTASWNDREVAVDVEGGQLVGTLSEPRVRASAERPAAPAVLFLGEPGPFDRHGMGGGLDRGTWQLLDRLADEGFVVLRLDGRGVGRSTAVLPPEQVGLERAVEDGKAALRFLRGQPSADPDALFVIGHGVGGLAAIRLAAEEELSGVVVLGMPYRRLSMMLAQAEAAALGPEADAAARERVLAEGRLLASAMAGNEAAQAQLAPERRQRWQPLRAWIVEAEALDWAQLLPKVQEEIGVFLGMKDFEVSWREDGKPLVDLMKKLGQKKAKLNVYENVDHLMKSEPKESSPRRYADRGRPVEPRFLDELVGWLRERATGKR